MIVAKDQHMNEEEKVPIYEIIEKYKVFFRVVDSNNLAKVAVHSIDTIGSAEPVHIKIYRYPKTHEQEVKEQINKLLKDGTIRESNSPWNSSAVISKNRTHREKPSGEWSLTIGN